MVVAYRVSKIEEVLKYLIKAPSIVLTNLVLDIIYTIIDPRIRYS